MNPLDDDWSEDWSDEPDDETLQAWREEDDERAQCLTAAERNPSM